MSQPKTASLFSIWKLSSLGIELGLCPAIGLIFGWWLDSQFETGGWLTMAGFCIGIAAAVLSLIKAVSESSFQDSDPNE